MNAVSVPGPASPRQYFSGHLAGPVRKVPTNTREVRSDILASEKHIELRNRAAL
jgi:hypothetical protein